MKKNKLIKEIKKNIAKNGGIEYATIDFNKNIFKEISDKKNSKKERNKEIIISLIISLIITLFGVILQHYHIL